MAVLLLQSLADLMTDPSPCRTQLQHCISTFEIDNHSFSAILIRDANLLKPACWELCQCRLSISPINASDHAYEHLIRVCAQCQLKQASIV